MYVCNLFVLIASIKKMRERGGDLPLTIQFSTKQITITVGTYQTCTQLLQFVLGLKEDWILGWRCMHGVMGRVNPSHDTLRTLIHPSIQSSLTSETSNINSDWVQVWLITICQSCPLMNRGQFNKTFTLAIYECSYCFSPLKQWLHL